MSFLITDTLRFTLTVKREDTAWRGQHYDSLARIEIPVELPIDWDGRSSGINVAGLDGALNFFKERIEACASQAAKNLPSFPEHNKAKEGE